MKLDGFGHEKPNEGETNDWITPAWIIDAFRDNGHVFDLDPCQSLTQPWLTARAGYTVKNDGLGQKWHGFVYCNPSYDTSKGG